MSKTIRITELTNVNINTIQYFNTRGVLFRKLWVKIMSENYEFYSFVPNEMTDYISKWYLLFRRSFRLLLVTVCFQFCLVITRFFDPDSFLPRLPKLSELQSERGFYPIIYRTIDQGRFFWKIMRYRIMHFTKLCGKLCDKISHIMR